VRHSQKGYLLAERLPGMAIASFSFVVETKTPI